MTILQFAKSQGITKNKAKYYLQQLPPELLSKDAKGVIQLSEEAVAQLIAIIGKTDEKPQETADTTTERTAEPSNAGELAALRAQLELQQRQIEGLQADKRYLQEQLSAAAARSDFLMIQTLPWYKRRKAMKAYQQRQLTAPIEQKDPE